ncbi:MAG: hypothetical protein OXG11_05155 [Chloroflexi bacterium]|nr:hypothetical protein [Chloroflexota bacterium]
MSTRRRPAQLGFYTQAELDGFSDIARYDGRSYHKSKPADYGLEPPASPRPTKSLCDDKRIIYLAEARELLESAIRLGMVSAESNRNVLPKYAWAVDEDGEVYEAKLGGDSRCYHGYRLSRDDQARKWILKEWKKRAGANS